MVYTIILNKKSSFNGALHVVCFHKESSKREVMFLHLKNKTKQKLSISIED